MPEAQLRWPGDGVAHLWPIDLRGVARGAVGRTGCLSHDEHKRAARLSAAAGARWRFIAARTALRTILAGYLRSEPDEVAFAYGPLVSRRSPVTPRRRCRSICRMPPAGRCVPSVTAGRSGWTLR
jgi:hypothetical protein